MAFEKLEQYRLKGLKSYGSKEGDNFGVFAVPSPIDPRIILTVMVAPMSELWQHVSVSTHRRCPNWPEMCKVKELVWGDDVTVVQFHPKKTEYVNNHQYCLHLWKKRDTEYALPPSIYVGLKTREA
jgi:hypothetical protein